MNDNDKNRVDHWLFITAVAVLFRGMTFLVDIVTTILGVMLNHIHYEIVRPIPAVFPILGPVVAVALAVLIARAVENRLIQMTPKRKKVLLSVMIVLAILPWQLQIKTTFRPLTWDEMPEHIREEWGLQPTPGGDSSTRADAGLETPQE